VSWWSPVSRTQARESLVDLSDFLAQLRKPNRRAEASAFVQVIMSARYRDAVYQASAPMRVFLGHRGHAHVAPRVRWYVTELVQNDW
jgi:hypothetical protein